MDRPPVARLKPRAPGLWSRLQSPEKERRGGDSNPRLLLHNAGFQDRCIRPLCHLSDPAASRAVAAAAYFFSCFFLPSFLSFFASAPYGFSFLGSAPKDWRSDVAAAVTVFIGPVNFRK